jgi:hypothetical protein
MARVTAPALEWVGATAGGLARRRQWRTTAPLWWGLQSPTGPDWLQVPAGFITDLASIPWPFVALVRPDSVSPAGPIVHDYLYANCGAVPVWRWDDGQGSSWIVDRPSFTRKQADAVFCDVLIATEVPDWKVRLMHRAVRIGGAGGWGR